MAVTSHLSVQAIRGRFEQFKGNGNNRSNTSQTFCRNGRSPLNSDQHVSQSDPPLLSPEVVLEMSRESISPSREPVPLPRETISLSNDKIPLSKESVPLPRESVPLSKESCSPVKDTRLRSFSVGNLHPSSYQKNDRETLSRKALTRNNSYGLNNYSNDSIYCNSNSNNFNSFSEKQKLVDSIVMNIKKSAANAKTKDNDQRSKDFRPFSKFEKDLKNVLERGVRRKGNVKSKENKPITKTSFENQENIRFSKEGIIDHRPTLEHKNRLLKRNSVLGVELCPINPTAHDETGHKNYDECQIKDNNDPGKPPVPAISNNITKLKRELISSKQNAESSQYDVCGSCVSYPTKKSFNYPTEKSFDFPTENSFPYTPDKSCDLAVRRFTEYPNNDQNGPETGSPVRPPRRKLKKYKAPIPPSPPKECDNDDTCPVRSDAEKHRFMPHRGATPSPTAAHYPPGPIPRLPKECNLEPQDQEEKRGENDFRTYFHNDQVNKSDESSYYSHNLDGRRRSAGEISKDFNYEDRYERNIERENVDDVFSDSYSNSNGEIEPLTRNNMSKSETELDTCAGLPPSSGSPPKKPPRTFAYDIYLSLKSDNKRGSHPRAGSVPKLSSAELDSLYTKPLKRLKDKPTSQSHLKDSKPDIRGSKPAVAPKPIDIIAKAKKRLSVTEPLPSDAESKEFSEHKPSVKRNSSFRFSFRKKKNSCSSASNATCEPKETRVGRRLKGATKMFQPKKPENEKRVRFQTDEDEKDIVSNDTKSAGGPIYATPYLKTDMPQDDQKELHYMCSPLFQNGNEYTNKNPIIENSSPHEIWTNSSGLRPRRLPAPPGTPPPITDENKERLGIMEELRQSYRLVQKRLKGVSQKEGDVRRAAVRLACGLDHIKPDGNIITAKNKRGPLV